MFNLPALFGADVCEEALKQQKMHFHCTIDIYYSCFTQNFPLPYELKIDDYQS